MRSPRRRYSRLVLPLVALLAALALSACGSDDESADTDLGPAPAEVTPADAPLYVDAVVRPEGDLEENLLSALRKLTGEEDPGAIIRSEIDEQIADEGFSYSEDIEPWLGTRVGGFVADLGSGGGGGSGGADVSGAAILAVTDADAARDAIQKAADADDLEETDETYDGVDYKVDSEGFAIGIVGDFLVAGPEAGLKAAVDASGGEPLSESEEASDALGSVPGDSLFRAYVDADAALDLAVAAGEVSEQDLEDAGEQLDQLREGPLVIAGEAGADSIAIEATGPSGDGGETTDIVSTLPGDAWLALGIPMIGESISAGFDSFLDSLESGADSLPRGTSVPDVSAEIESAIGLDLAKDLDWAGDTGIYAAGSSLLAIGGGIVIDTDDEAAASEALEKMRRRLAAQRLQISRTPSGFQIQGIGGAPFGAEATVEDGKLVVAVGGVTIDDLLNPSETLEESATFSDASSALDGLSPAVFVDFEAIVTLIESAGQSGSEELDQAGPVLDAIDYLVAGSGDEGDRSIGKLVLGLKEPDSGSGTAAAISP